MLEVTSSGCNRSLSVLIIDVIVKNSGERRNIESNCGKGPKRSNINKKDSLYLSLRTMSKDKRIWKVALGFIELKRKGLKVTHILCGRE